MSLDAAETQSLIAMLVEDLEGGQGDRHEIWLELQTLIKHLRGAGAAIPDDLQKMEADMAGEFDD